MDKPVDLGAPSQVPTGISMLIIIFAIIYLLIQNPTRPHIFVFSPNAPDVCYCKMNKLENILMLFPQSKDATGLLLGKMVFPM